MVGDKYLLIKSSTKAGCCMIFSIFLFDHFSVCFHINYLIVMLTLSALSGSGITGRLGTASE